MAKKKETKKEMVTEEVTEVVEQPKIVVKEKPLPTPKKDTWEIKDRFYYLKGDKKPLSKMIKSANIASNSAKSVAALTPLIPDDW